MQLSVASLRSAMYVATSTLTSDFLNVLFVSFGSHNTELG